MCCLGNQRLWNSQHWEEQSGANMADLGGQRAPPPPGPCSHRGSPGPVLPPEGLSHEATEQWGAKGLEKPNSAQTAKGPKAMANTRHQKDREILQASQMPDKEHLRSFPSSNLSARAARWGGGGGGGRAKWRVCTWVTVLSTVLWGKLVGSGLVFFWQEAPGRIIIHSLIHSFSGNKFDASVLRIPFAWKGNHLVIPPFTIAGNLYIPIEIFTYYFQGCCDICWSKSIIGITHEHSGIIDSYGADRQRLLAFVIEVPPVPATASHLGFGLRFSEGEEKKKKTSKITI